MLNEATICGRLGKDPEIRNFQSGGRVVNLRVATTDKWKDRDGNRQEKTEWHSVAIFHERLGEIAEQYLQKGSMVLLRGALETRKWQGQDGQDRYSTEIVLRGPNSVLRLMGGNRRDDDGGGDSRPAERPRATHRPADRLGGGPLDDDIPFAPEAR